MHISGKIFMGIGVFICLAGVVLMALGGENIDDVGEWDVVEKSNGMATVELSTFVMEITW